MSRQGKPTPLGWLLANGLSVQYDREADKLNIGPRSKITTEVRQLIVRSRAEIIRELETPPRKRRRRVPRNNEEKARELARQGDPSTSRMAAWQILAELPELQQQAYDALVEWPGLTDREMSTWHPVGSDSRKLGRRYNELERDGLARRVEKRIDRVTGRWAHPWYAIVPEKPNG